MAAWGSSSDQWMLPGGIKPPDHSGIGSLVVEVQLLVAPGQDSDAGLTASVLPVAPVIGVPAIASEVLEDPLAALDPPLGAHAGPLAALGPVEHEPPPHARLAGPMLTDLVGNDGLVTKVALTDRLPTRGDLELHGPVSPRSCHDRLLSLGVWGTSIKALAQQFHRPVPHVCPLRERARRAPFHRRTETSWRCAPSQSAGPPQAPSLVARSYR